MLLERKNNFKDSVLDNLKYKQQNWYGHVNKMDGVRLPRKFWNGVRLEEEEEEEEEEKEDLEIFGCRK